MSDGTEILGECYRLFKALPRVEQVAGLRWLSARLEYDALVASELIHEDGSINKPTRAPTETSDEG